MDKLIHTDQGVTISNDGATIMKLLDVVHPAAQTLVEIAKSQDSEVTTHSKRYFFPRNFPHLFKQQKKNSPLPQWFFFSLL
jgi:hypothetical protein